MNAAWNLVGCRNKGQFITELVAATNRVIEQGDRDPNADELAVAVFNDELAQYRGQFKADPEMFFTVIANCMNHVRRRLRRWHGVLTVPVSRVYYREYRGAVAMLQSDQLVRCLPGAATGSAIGMYVPDDEDDPLFLEYKQRKTRRVSGAIREDLRETAAARDGGLLSIEETRSLLHLVRPRLADTDMKRIEKMLGSKTLRLLTTAEDSVAR